MKKNLELLEKFSSAISSANGELIVIVSENLTVEFQKLFGTDLLGYTAKNFEQFSILEKIYPDDKALFNSKFSEMINDQNLGKIVRFQIRIQSVDGFYTTLDVSGKNLSDTLGIKSITFRFREIDFDNLSPRILSGQKPIIESIALGKPLKQTLLDIAILIEDLMPEECFASILIYNEKSNTLSPVAAPHLPPSFVQKLNELPVGENSGSCGASALWKKTIITADIETDPRCSQARDWIIKDYGFRSCFSLPLLSQENNVLGVLTLYSKRKKNPSDNEMALINSVIHLAVIAIERNVAGQSVKEGQQILSESEARYKNLVEGFNDVILITDLHSRLLYANPAMTEQTGYVAADIQNSPILDVFFHPDEVAFVRKFVTDFILSRKSHSNIIENRIIDKKGNELWFSSILSFIKYDGRWAIQFISRNITNLKKIQEKVAEKEVQYSALFEGAKDAVMLFDATTEMIIDANHKAEILFGYTRDELVRLHYHQLFPPSYTKSGKLEVLETSELAESDKFFSDIVNHVGRRTRVEITTGTIALSNGKKLNQRIFRDLTEMKRLEVLNQVQSSISRAINSSKNIDELLKLIHRSLGLIIDTTNFYIALIDKKKGIITFPYFIDLEDEDYSLVSLENENSITVKVIKSGQPLLLKANYFENLSNEGGPFLGSLPKVWLGVPLTLKGEVMGVVAVQSYTNADLYNEADIHILSSISEQIAIAIQKKQTEDEIRDSEERYRVFIEHSTEGIYRIEFDKPIHNQLSTDEKIKLFYENAYMAECNQFFVNKYGYTKLEEVAGIRAPQFMQSTDPNHINYLTRMLHSHGQIVDQETHEIDRFGIDKYYLNNAIVISEGDYMVRIWGTQRDITNRKLVDKALWEEKERLSVTLKSIVDGVITMNVAGRVTLMNKSAEKYTGWKQREAYGHNIDEIFHVVDDKNKKLNYRINEILKSDSENLTLNTLTLIKKDGSDLLIEESSSPIKDNANNIMGAVIVFRDISEKRKMEEEILRTRKVESVGLLAGGIAHDFNNILTAVLGNLSLAKLQIEEKSRLYNMLDSAEKASSRAISLTQQLLTFSKGGAPIKKVASIRELLVESVTFALRGTNVSAEFVIAEDLWTVEIDEGQINQVINNLIINAVQAMPDGGKITITVAPVDLNDSRPALLKLEQRYIRMAICDTGAGIEEKNLTKIFDPYFSTKEKGSGLGLATSYSIVSKHEGLITVQSQVGVGTCFYIFLPASEKELVPELLAHSVKNNKVGKIIIMDDEDSIRELGKEILTTAGHEVVGVSSGKEAISAYRQALRSEKPFDLIIMDLTIPGGMGGKQAIGKVLELNPSAIVIVSSGYSNDPIMSNHSEYGFKGVLHKPFKANDLLDIVNNMLALSSNGAK